MLRQLLQDPEEWSASDVQRLLADQIPEGQRVEYKATLALDSKKQKAEVAKDVSGLANAQGGWIFFGISEGDGPEPLPETVTPLEAGGLQTRLENILDSSLEPIPEYRAATISVSDGVVILVRISRVSGLPVMVQGYDQNRYFVRSGTRTRPMNASEIAQAHAAAQQQVEVVDQRLQDLPLVSEIGPGLRIPSLSEVDASPAVCLVVAAIDGAEELIKRSLIRKDSFQECLDGYRSGRSVRQQAWAITAFGLMEEERVAPPPPPQDLFAGINHRPVPEDDNRLKVHRVGVFRTGVIEWAHRYPLGQILPSTSMADDVHNALLFAARTLDAAGYSGRLKVWLRIMEVEEAVLQHPPGWDVTPRSPDVRELDFSCEATTDQLLVDPTPTTRAALDAVWQGFGIDRCVLFDGEGNWRD